MARAKWEGRELEEGRRWCCRGRKKGRKRPLSFGS